MECRPLQVLALVCSCDRPGTRNARTLNPDPRTLRALGALGGALARSWFHRQDAGATKACVRCS